MKPENVSLPLSLMDLSHELRTPLTGIAGMAAFLAKSQLSSEQCQYVADIKRSCARLKKLADLLSSKAKKLH